MVYAAHGESPFDVRPDKQLPDLFREELIDFVNGGTLPDEYVQVPSFLQTQIDDPTLDSYMHSRMMQGHIGELWWWAMTLLQLSDFDIEYRIVTSFPAAAFSRSLKSDFDMILDTGDELWCIDVKNYYSDATLAFYVKDRDVFSYVAFSQDESVLGDVIHSHRIYPTLSNNAVLLQQWCDSQGFSRKVRPLVVFMPSIDENFVATSNVQIIKGSQWPGGVQIVTSNAALAMLKGSIEAFDGEFDPALIRRLDMKKSLQEAICFQQSVLDNTDEDDTDDETTLSNDPVDDSVEVETSATSDADNMDTSEPASSTPVSDTDVDVEYFRFPSSFALDAEADEFRVNVPVPIPAHKMVKGNFYLVRGSDLDFGINGNKLYAGLAINKHVGCIHYGNNVNIDYARLLVVEYCGTHLRLMAGEMPIVDTLNISAYADFKRRCENGYIVPLRTDDAGAYLMSSAWINGR